MTLAGCRAATGPHVLVIADNADPSSLNPLLAHDQDTIGYDLLVTQTLVGLSAANRLVPVRVTRIPSRSNGDISPISRRCKLEVATPSSCGSSSDGMQRSPSSLPRPTLLSAFFPHAFTSEDVTRAAWNGRPFGTGPFRVVEWQRASQIVLDRNPYYRPLPKLRRIVLELIPTTQGSLLALRAKGVDVTEIGPVQVPEAGAIPGAHVVITPINGVYLLMMQTSAPPTTDARVRRAIAAAIDAKQIARAGYGVLRAGDSFLPPVFPWHDPGSTTSDPATVTRELSAAGWQKRGGRWMKGGEPLSVTLTLAPERGTWMQLIEQEQLRRVGIDAQLKPYSTALFNAPNGPLRMGAFTLAATWWIGAADPEESVIFACSQRGENGNNSMNYCSRRFDSLFEEQAVTAD